MQEAKNTQRSLVRIGFDGKVHKLFRGPEANTRFENEVRVLNYLKRRNCPFVPRVLDANNDTLELVTSNCGARVQHITDDKVAQLFGELEKYGVRHDDPFLRNITYRASDGRFCVIDFEFAEILEPLDAADISTRREAASHATQLKWSGLTDRGRFRPNNEDAFLAMLLNAGGIKYLGKTGEATVDDSDFIFAVSDGMGGERSGEFASRIAVEKITLQLPRQFSLAEERFSAYSDDIFGSLFSSIHDDMLKLGRYDANCRDMGATLTLAWFRRGRIYFGHIGDSRLYHLPADGTLTQITEDHTHVGWLRRNGKLNEREARMHPRKNVLAQALGSGHRFLNPHVGVLEYAPGDKFLLCTDGVTEGLWDRRLQDYVAGDSPAESTRAQQIVSAAVAESGRDNATAVVVEAF